MLPIVMAQLLPFWVQVAPCTDAYVAVDSDAYDRQWNCHMAMETKTIAILVKMIGIPRSENSISALPLLDFRFLTRRVCIMLLFNSFPA